MSTWQIKAVTFGTGGVRSLDLAPPVLADDGDYDDLQPIIAEAERLCGEGAEAHGDVIVIVGENWNERTDEKAVGLWWTSRDGYVGG